AAPAADPGVGSRNETYFASSSDEEEQEDARQDDFPAAAAEDNSPFAGNSGGAAGDNSRGTFGSTWGVGNPAEEDRAAAAAATAIAGVGWRRLRRDTVAALVRQLGRATAERDRV
ncbi:unnamed protein product, partial [Scytosiphon promiscuus]